MNRKWKRTASLLLAATMTTALAACGGSPSESKGAASGSPAAGEMAKPPAKTVEIEFWYGLGGKLGETMQGMIDDFNASQQEVVVKGVAQSSYDETKQKLQAAIAAGNPPAAALTEDKEWAQKGYFKALDEYIAADPDFHPEDFVESFYQPGNVDGKQYFIPLYGTTQVLYYRKDMFEKAGIDPAQLATWEGLADAARKLAVKENGETKVYGWEPMWDAANLVDSVYSRGGQVLSDDGTKVMIDTPEWIETWESFRKWIHEEKIMRIHYGGQGWEYWYKTIDDVMQGRAAGYTGSTGDMADLDFSIIASAPQPGWGDHPAKPEANAQFGSIPAKAKPEQQEAAYKWFRFLTSRENTAKWSMATGYIAVRNSAAEDPAFIEFVEQNPQYAAPLQQAKTARSGFKDPTGGKIWDALNLAADKLEIDNKPAAEVLKEAQETAQRELDRFLKK